MTEWNEWIEAEKQELSKVMGRHGVQWKQLGTHNKHLLRIQTGSDFFSETAP